MCGELIWCWDASAWYAVVLNGTARHLFGTSASSPVVAGFLSSINDARLAIGKKPIGFINPTVRPPSLLLPFIPSPTSCHPLKSRPGR